MGRRINMTHYLLIIDTKARAKDVTRTYECNADNIGGSDVASTKLTIKGNFKFDCIYVCSFSI